MNDTPRSRPDIQRLFDLASEQHGHFTTQQAQDVGFSRALLSYHAGTGRLERIRRGLYRLREYPSSPHEATAAAWLAAGPDSAVVSHESALDLLELSDIIPGSVHLTIPRERRYMIPTPGVTIHTTTRPLRADEVIVRSGIRLTSPVRSILDAAEAGSPPDQIERAVMQTVEQGLATREQLRSEAEQRDGRIRNLINRALEKAR